MSTKRLVIAIGILIGVVLQAAAFPTPSASAAAAGRTAIRGLDPYTDSISVRPSNGPAGTEVRAHGFVGENSSCRRVTIEFVDSTGAVSVLYTYIGGSFDITRNIPLGAALGPGRIQGVRWVLLFHQTCVREGGGPQAPFTVTNALGILGFSPRTGPVGTMVTITGIRFTGVTAVGFNGTPSVFSVDSDTQITATVPAGATNGPIEIDKPGGVGIQKAISGPDFVVCSGAIC